MRNPRNGGKKCEKFAKLLAENNGKLPPTYEGAYEQWLKRRTGDRPAAAICEPEPLTEDESSDDEKPKLGAAVTRWRPVKKGTKLCDAFNACTDADCKDTDCHPNEFARVAPEDSDEPEDETK